MKKYLHQLVAKEKKSYVKVSSCVMTRPGCVQALFSQIQGYRLHSGKKSSYNLKSALPEAE